MVYLRKQVLRFVSKMRIIMKKSILITLIMGQFLACFCMNSLIVENPYLKS